jgi:hypothetical protein
MEASYIATGTVALVGAASAIWGLVTVWDSKRKQPGLRVPFDPPPPVTLDVPELKEMPARLEEAFGRAMAKQAAPPLLELPEPDWHRELVQEVALQNERLAVVMQQPARPQPELAKLVAELARMNVSLEETRRAQPVFSADEMAEKLGEVLRAQRASEPPRALAAPPRGGGGASIPAQFVAPAPARAPDVNLVMFNTITLAANDLYELVPPEGGAYHINLANFGPGTIYFRRDAVPVPGDPQAETMPAGWLDNEIPIPVTLHMVADDVATISARLIYP